MASLQALIEEFSQLSLEPQLEFYSFTLKDIQEFERNDNQFCLSFKKAVGQYILYGKKHVDIRRQFFNHLEPTYRNNLFLKKVQAAGIFQWLETQIQENLCNCTIEDIGMGKSVYKLSLPSGKSWVLKSDCTAYVAVYEHVLSVLGHPVIGHAVCKTEQGTFLLMEDKGPVTVNDAVLNQNIDVSLAFKMGRQAALGDIFLRGDRHLENYLLQDNEVYSIDITYLFYPNNAFWTARYQAAGAYEMSCCFDMSTQKYNLDLLDSFWEAYFCEARHVLKHSKCLSLYSKEIKENLAYFSKYYDSMIHAFQKMCLNNASVFLYRFYFKNLLDKLYSGKNRPTCVYEKMYYFANEDRVNAFLHVEEHSKSLFEKMLKEARLVDFSLTHKDLIEYITVEYKKITTFLERKF